MSLILPIATAKEARRIFDALSAGEQVVLPPTETSYSTLHVSLVEKFGIFETSWLKKRRSCDGAFPVEIEGGIVGSTL